MSNLTISITGLTPFLVGASASFRVGLLFLTLTYSAVTICAPYVCPTLEMPDFEIYLLLQTMGRYYCSSVCVLSYLPKR